MGTTTFILLGTVFLLAIALSYLVMLGTGAQSITADRDTRRSNSMNNGEEVRQQGIIKNYY